MKIHQMQTRYVSMVAASIVFTALVAVPFAAKSAAVASSSAQGARTQGGKSKITSVTVFRDRAIVTRTQAIALKSGPITLQFENVTPIIDRNSLKISLSNSKKADILGIRYFEKHHLRAKDPELLKWQKKKEAFYKKRQNLVNRVQGLVRSNQHVANLAEYYQDSFSIQIQENRWSQNQFRAFLKLVRSKTSTMQATWKKIFTEYNEVEKEIEFTREKISELSSVDEKKSLTILIDLVVNSPGTQNFELKYLVTNSGWKSVYDVRFDGKKGVVQLEQYAHVWQNSGEDWKGVDLELSNVTAEIKPRVPSISSYSLSWRKVKKVKTRIKNKVADAEVMTVGSTSDSSPKDEKGLAKTFVISGKQSISQGLNQTKVFVAKKQIKFAEHLELVPSLYKKVFRKAELFNPFPWKLNSGPLHAYYNGGYLNKTRLAPVAKGDQFSLNIGIEHNLTVRYWRDNEVKEPGLIGSDRKYKRVSRTRLTNYDGKKRSIRVLEQSPVSEIDSVEVSLLEESTKGYKKDADHPGWVYWNLEVEPRKTGAIDFAVQVIAPKEIGFSWN